MASDGDGKITQSYDVVLQPPPAWGPNAKPVSNRTSYVIAPNGKVLYEYTSLDPSKHVANTMAVLKRWRVTHNLD